MARLHERMLEGWRRIARKWRIAIAAGFTLAMTGASAAGYRQWHYMQHDNRFCTSCHLMRDPYERFTRSAHARLECHNCHKASFTKQVAQLYAVIVDRPTTVQEHADVPNEVCGSCHIKGDSTRWKIIAHTAGHRRHLESSRSALRGMRCVTCHGVSVHEFAPVDRTCGQSGCHAQNLIRLGKMGGVTELHCTTCHSFLAEARTVAMDSLGQPLTPAVRQCVSCHAMQQRLRDLEVGQDPHRGVCGDCHNPHVQATPQVSSCTRGACHSGWRSVSFHVGVPHPERCTACHQAHSWRVEGKNCTRCHARDISRVAAAGRLPASTARAAAAPAAPAQPRVLPPFSHGIHRGQPCATCHSSAVRHGQLLVRGVEDCQRCHHVGPGREQCATCHSTASLRQPLSSQPRTFRLAVGRTAVSRQIPFEHARHGALACVQCHSNPVSRAPEGAECASCHAPHHQATSGCTACHAASNAIAKHTASSHASCTSAACHGSRAADLPVSREFCLVCHRTQATHMPGRSCDGCHRVTTPERR